MGKPRARVSRIREIAHRMARGEWYGGRSHAELAAAWGLTVAQVHTLAMRAGEALVVLAQENKAAILAQMVCSIEDIRRRAVEAKRALVMRDGTSSYVEYVDEPDLPSALKALTLKAELMQILPRAGEQSQTTTVQVAIDARSVNAMSDSDVRRLLAEEHARVSRMLALDATAEADVERKK